jgi:hypothetical protein
MSKTNVDESLDMNAGVAPILKQMAILRAQHLNAAERLATAIRSLYPGGIGFKADNFMAKYALLKGAFKKIDIALTIPEKTPEPPVVAGRGRYFQLASRAVDMVQKNGSMTMAEILTKLPRDDHKHVRRAGLGYAIHKYFVRAGKIQSRGRRATRTYFV